MLFFSVCICAEISKAVDMYMFLFDDILLLTRVKKAPRKVIQLERFFYCNHFYST